MTIDDSANVISYKSWTINKSGANLKVVSDNNVYLSLDTTQTNGDERHIFNANSGATSTLQFKNIDQSKVVMFLNENGKIGINNVDPGEALDIVGNLRFKGYNRGNINHLIKRNKLNNPIPSGSTRFGDSQDDIHEFTGSVNISAASPMVQFLDNDVTGLKHRIIGGGNAGLEIGADTENVLSSVAI